MKKYIITIIVLILIILLSIGGYFAFSRAKTNTSNSTQMLKQKAIAEIEYLDNEIIEIMNKLNNISYSNYELINKEIDSREVTSENSTSSENSIDSTVVEFNNIITGNQDNIDWDDARGKLENMYDTWTSILIDLTTLNVNKDNLLKYNDLLDEIIVGLEKKDKITCLNKLTDLYNLIVLYTKDFAGDDQKVHVYTVKSNVLYAYANATQENWNKVREYVSNAKQEFNSIMNNQVNNVDNIDIINKAYILINELEEDGKNENKTIFYINYVNLIQELNNI